jgi:CubicO group peptidase (beta-lactamase class C family)
MIEIKAEILEAIDRCFSEFCNSSKIPGIQYGISFRGNVIHAGSLGYGKLEPALSMQRNSISRIASMTKSFATAAVLRLRDKGLVDLKAPLSSIIPELTLAAPFSGASLEELMAMKLDLPPDDPWADRLLDATDAELERYFTLPLLRAGRGSTSCSYSNLSYILLGRIIAKIAGQSAMDYISGEILKPLGLCDTLWNVPDEKRHRMAMGYRVDADLHAEERLFTCQSDGVVFGGLWSTVDDLAVWIEFLRGADDSSADWDVVLSKASRRELWQPRSSSGAQSERSLITGEPIIEKAEYGFGLVAHDILGVTYVAHSGGLPGYGSHMRVHPSTGFGIVALGNGTYCPAASPCASALHYLMLSLDPSLQAPLDTVLEVGRNVATFVLSGEQKGSPDLFTYNVWQDTLPHQFAIETKKVFGELGEDVHVASIVCVSGCQGEVVFAGRTGTRKLSYTLAPHLPARVQSIAWVAEKPT